MSKKSTHTRTLTLKSNPDVAITVKAIEAHLQEAILGLDYLGNLELIVATNTWDEIVVTSPRPSNPAVEDGDTVEPENSGPSTQGRVIPWGKQCKKLHPDFIDGVLWIESQLGLKAEYLISCMKFESNLNPKARNPKSTASGLIQFMAGTAKNMGTTIEHIRKLGPMEQLSWVYKYFKAFGKDLSNWDIADTYMAILWPAGIGKPMSHRIFVDDERKANDAYDVNKGLDKDKDGFVTKKEAAQKVIDLYEAGMQPENALVL